MVASSLELFGPLVSMIKEDGKFTFKFTKGSAPCTIQLGASLAVNVTEVLNNELKVTPITVRDGGKAGDVVLFCCTGASGLEHANTADESSGTRVNFAALKREVEELERLGAFDTYANTRQGSPTEGNRRTKQDEAEESEKLGDEMFWQAMYAEKVDRPERLLHCPVFDGDCRPGLESRLKYTEALRYFGQCTKLDHTKMEYFMKRGATLCKLMQFEKAMSDADTYVGLRPNSPTGHCLKGVVNHGLRQYGAAIHSFRKGLELGDIVVYDKSRVWSTGTLLRSAMELTIDLRASVAERAKVANQHGVHWRELGQFSRALPCLLEAVDLNAQSVGVNHPFYGTSLNNVGACLEAMGNYQDAMKQYTAALRVTERVSKGTLRVYLVSGRHLPHGMEDGTWDGEEWLPTGFSCDAYVRMELEQTAREGDERLIQNKSKTAGAGDVGGERGAEVVSRTSRVAHQSYQPVWNHLITLRADSGEAMVTFVLMSQSRQRRLLEDKAEELRQGVRECAELIRDVEDRIAPLQQRVARLKELGRVKQAELAKARRGLEEVQQERVPLQQHSDDLQAQVAALERRQQALPDREIGRFSYALTKLSTTLNGQASSSEKAWFSIPDGQGGKLRGEDYGITAVQIELTWTPEDAEYATRLSNIGNLHRILGDQFSSRAGVACDLRKLEQHYQLAEQYLEEALTAMRRATSTPPPEQEGLLAAALQQRTKEGKGTATPEAVDGTQTLPYCVVLENLALLNQALGSPQAFPKGTPETVKAKFETVWKENQAKAIERLEQAMAIRTQHSGAASKEYLSLLQSLIEVHIDRQDYPTALHLQEEAAALSRQLYGEFAEQTTRQTNLLNRLHLLSGNAEVRELGPHARDGWMIDTAEAWHWAAVQPLSRRVNRAAAKAQQQCTEQDRTLAKELKTMEERKKLLLDPEPITDYALSPTGSLYLKAPRPDDPSPRQPLETGESGQEGAKKSPLKSAKVRASKLQTPDTELVRRDIQPWPHPTHHTKAS